MHLPASQVSHNVQPHSVSEKKPCFIQHYTTKSYSSSRLDKVPMPAGTVPPRPALFPKMSWASWGKLLHASFGREPVRPLLSRSLRSNGCTSKEGVKQAKQSKAEAILCPTKQHQINTV